MAVQAIELNNWRRTACTGANCEEIQGYNCSSPCENTRDRHPSLMLKDCLEIGQQLVSWKSCQTGKWHRNQTRRWQVKERKKTEVQQRKSEGVNPEEEVKRLTRFLYCWEYISKSWLKKGNIEMKDTNKQTYTWQTNKQKYTKKLLAEDYVHLQSYGRI